MSYVPVRLPKPIPPAPPRMEARQAARGVKPVGFKPPPIRITHALVHAQGGYCLTEPCSFCSRHDRALECGRCRMMTGHRYSCPNRPAHRSKRRSFWRKVWGAINGERDAWRTFEPPTAELAPITDDELARWAEHGPK